MIADISGLHAARNLRWAVGMPALLALAFGLVFSWTTWQSEKAREMQYLFSLVNLGEKSLDAYFASVERALKSAGQDMIDSSGALDLERGALMLQRLRQFYPEMQVAMAIRPDGQIVLSTDGAARGELPSLANETSFKLAREAVEKTRALHIGRPFPGLVSKQWVIPLRYGVRDGNDKLVFLLGVGLPLSKSQSLWKDVPLPPNAAMGLIGDDGYLRSRYPLPHDTDLAEIYGKPSVGAFGPLMSGPGAPRSGSMEINSTVTRENSLVAYHRLSAYPVTFFVITPRSNLLAAWWRSVRFSYALMLLILVGALALYRWALKRQISWELEREQRITELQAINEDLQSFSYSVSHDLRAPLRSITGFSNVLKRDNAQQLSVEGKTNIERIIGAATRMAKLIEDLLNLTQVSREEFSPATFNLSEIAAEVCNNLVQAHPQRHVNLRIEPDMFVMADPGLMRIVLENLLGNAWKFTGKLEQADIEVGSTVIAGTKTYFVRDNGAGFDMDHAGRLFVAFQRLHHNRDFEGTGIGLATVKRVVQRHRGKVWIESAVDRGTTVYFTIA